MHNKERSHKAIRAEDLEFPGKATIKVKTPVDWGLKKATEEDSNNKQEQEAIRDTSSWSEGTLSSPSANSKPIESFSNTTKR